MFLFVVFSYSFSSSFFFVFAAALAALGAEGRDSSKAISDDLPLIGFIFASIVYVYLNRVLLPSFFFAAALAALGAEGSDSSNAISDDLPTADEPLWAASLRVLPHSPTLVATANKLHPVEDLCKEVHEIYMHM